MKWLASTVNKKGAQLIFTTHDTSLLDPDLFRRDQIWFVEKDRDQASKLYPLSDFSPRKNEALERGYLMGQYPIPLVILARLAIDLDDQRRGLGFSLLQDAISRTVAVAEQAGIRALLTHPIGAEADAFYRRFGFEPTPAHERQLILLLKDARRFVRA